MRKTSLILILAAFAAVAVISQTTWAGCEVADVIVMKNAAYAEHSKPIVSFTHKKHYTEFGATCGECHHDDKGQALADLKEGDDVQPCIACHKKPGEMPRDEKKEVKGLPKDEKKAREMAYQAEAIHENCQGCHKDHNKDKGLKKGDAGFAPTSCNDCHVK
ncbi:MAG: cytochrome c3 family protein [Pseudomonadota bacterium]